MTDSYLTTEKRLFFLFCWLGVLRRQRVFGGGGGEGESADQNEKNSPDAKGHDADQHEQQRARGPAQ